MTSRMESLSAISRILLSGTLRVKARLPEHGNGKSNFMPARGVPLRAQAHDTNRAGPHQVFAPPPIGGEENRGDLESKDVTVDFCTGNHGSAGCARVLGSGPAV